MQKLKADSPTQLKSKNHTKAESRLLIAESLTQPKSKNHAKLKAEN